ncbi:hypothetical protein GGQ99_005066 [Aminobacter niigataensis]|uniref:Uncharacterized protein n=1 Tax=Aminobacter niigataensis TaxID=83265 RepID=A0ABR6LBH8_9HYPH|nr:hypothetical protein [Aminobacter niigataensis]MBB4653281.1 hypothetical protein [Aminobacter niigataensis]
MAAKKKWLDCFVPHRLEMLMHPTWNLAPVPLRRMLERLEVEHLRHGGYKNGELFVSFNQFVAASISRRKITATQDLGEALGLMEVIRSTETSGDLRAPNSYRLTYVPAINSKAPTDEWKAVSSDRAGKLVEAYFEIERRRVTTALKEVA